MIKSWAKSLLMRRLQSKPPEAAADWLAGEARAYCKSNPPGQGLRFLLELDNRLASLRGPVAVASEGGLHPKHRLTKYHDFFTARVKPGERAIDIGCGIGAVARDLAEKSGASVVGIDLSAENIRAAREKNAHPRVQYIQGDARRDLPPGRFDVAVLSNVLEHIDRRVEFLRDVQRSAAPARWLIRVPMFERDWTVAMKKEMGIEWRCDATHCTEHTVEEFLEEMNAAGLTPAHTEIRWGEIWCELRPAGGAAEG